MRILIVEDHVDSAELMARLLRKAGHEVSIAPGVGAALAEVADGKPKSDLVLSDVMLPDGSGMDLMPHLRAAGVRHAIAISGTAEDAETARKCGFDAHLLKPVQFDQLMELIQRLQ